MFARRLIAFLITLSLTVSIAAQAGTFTNSGTGCPVASPPTLSMSPLPNIGTTPMLTASGLPGDTILAVLLASNAQASVPLDSIGATGCTLLLANTFSIGMVLTVPSASAPLALPLNPTFLGATLELQAAAVAPSSNSLGLAMSDRGTMTVGGLLQLLRDPTCANEPACFEQGAYMGSSKSGSVWNPSAFPMSLSTARSIVELQGVGALSVGHPQWNAATWTLNIWSSAQAFANQGLAGDVVNNAPLTLTHTPVGAPTHRNHLVTLRPSAGGVTLTPGSYYVGVLVDGQAWAWRETPTNLGSDIVTNDVNVGTYFLYNPTLNYDPGSSYIKVWGY